ncbi:hypothetical protein AMK26_34810 [Streptomyces sp. CB03234]|nr:hypothetical protein AMK26_34810 [Streptomyces sp. CB03234]
MNGRSRIPAPRWLLGSGAAFVGAGAVMYVLPGPGLPLLGVGVLLLLVAALLRLLGGGRR